MNIKTSLTVACSTAVLATLAAQIFATCTLPGQVCTPDYPLGDKQAYCCTQLNPLYCYMVQKQWYQCFNLPHHNWLYSEDTVEGDCGTKPWTCITMP